MVAANSLNITQSGFQSFNGVSIFQGRTLTAGTGISITNGNGVSGDPIISLIGGGAAIQTIAGDTGSITGANVTIYADNGSFGSDSGKTVLFENAGTISQMKLSDDDFNTLLGRGCATGTTLSGGQNVGIGIGFNSLTSGNSNVGVGAGFGANLSTGSLNILLGLNPGNNLVSGQNNILIGQAVGTAYTTNESFNIVLNNGGVVGDNFVTRIGDETTQAECYIAGINGNTVANQEFVTIDNVTGQLGTVSSIVSSSVGSSAFLTTDVPNATGNGAMFAIPYDATIYNDGSAYDTTTFVYTAAKTGKYTFSGTVGIIILNPTETQAAIFLQTTAQLFQIYTINPFAMSGNGNLIIPFVKTCQMTAGDTAYVQVGVYGGASDDVTVSANNNTFEITFLGA